MPSMSPTSFDALPSANNCATSCSLSVRRCIVVRVFNGRTIGAQVIADNGCRNGAGKVQSILPKCLCCLNEISGWICLQHQAFDPGTQKLIDHRVRRKVGKNEHLLSRMSFRGPALLRLPRSRQVTKGPQ